MERDPLDPACTKVGRFLHEFAYLESEINESIAQILSLKGDAADVVAYGIDFFKKVNILRVVARETAPDKHKANLDKLFSAIAKQNENRVLMAHAMFIAGPGGSVLFMHKSAKDGKVKGRDAEWTEAMFEDAYARVREIRERVAELRPTLTISISPEGKSEILSSYHYGSLTSSNVGGATY